MRRHVYISGEKVPVRARRLPKSTVGKTYKPTKGRKRTKRRIDLSKALRGHEKLSTLVHEMLHQVNWKLSEKTILRLEEQIVRMVEENPEVFQDLSSLLEK